MISDALGPVFLLILFGAFVKRIGFPGGHFWLGAERLTYFVLFPALLVHRLASADFNGVQLERLAGTITASLVLISLGLYLVRRRLAKDGPAFTSVFQGGIRFNTYIGLACASELYGEAGLVLASVTVAIMIPLINLLCVLVFSIEGNCQQFHWKSLSRSILQNPLILACVLGVFLNESGIGLPGWSADTLGILSAAALPLGLLAVGVAIDINAIKGATLELLSASLTKFLILPAMTLAISQMTSLATENQKILLLFVCLPTASSAYILARQLGGDTTLMANIVSAQTLFAFIAMPIWIAIAGLLPISIS